MQVPQGGCFPGCCWPTAREDPSDGDEVGALAGGSVSGRGENDLDVLVHDLPNSLVDGATGNVLGDMDIVGAAARRGEKAYSIDTRPAELNRVKRFAGVNSFDSVICRPSVHAPSLARVFDGKSGWVSGMVCCEGVGRGLRGRDTARSGALQHPACNPRSQGLPVMTVQMFGGPSLLVHVRCVGLNLGGGNEVVEEGFSVQGKAGCWRQVCFFLSSCQEGCTSRRGPVVARAST